MNGRTPLHEAAERDKGDVVKLLINRGGKINALDEKGESIVFQAAKYGSPQLVESLKGEDDLKTFINSDGTTMLHIACRYGNKDLVEWLLEQGLDPRAKNNNGDVVITEVSKSQLLFSKETRSYKFEEIIWKKISLDNNAYIRTSAYNPYEVDIEIIKLLINYKANVNESDRNGKTLLHYAAERAQEEIVKFLIKSKHEGGGESDITAKDENSETALDLAKKVGDLDMVKVLEEKINQLN